jgi:hypothetical protein
MSWPPPHTRTTPLRHGPLSRFQAVPPGVSNLRDLLTLQAAAAGIAVLSVRVPRDLNRRKR